MNHLKYEGFTPVVAYASGTMVGFGNASNAPVGTIDPAPLLAPM